MGEAVGTRYIGPQDPWRLLNPTGGLWGHMAGRMGTRGGGAWKDLRGSEGRVAAVGTLCQHSRDPGGVSHEGLG